MKQVVTKDDWFHAVYDYLFDRLSIEGDYTGDFRLQHMEYAEIIDDFLDSLRSPFVQINADTMAAKLVEACYILCTILTECKITGCSNEDHHKFVRSFLDLIWESHDATNERLKAAGIIPGQSSN